MHPRLPLRFGTRAQSYRWCCHQAQSTKARQAARFHGRQVVWWVTVVEATSSIRRLTREGYLAAVEARQSLARLDHLRLRWNEVQPTEEVRHRAERLIGSHHLRPADVLQLGAALVWCNNHPKGRTFVSSDNHLADAAEAEGFNVIRV